MASATAVKIACQGLRSTLRKAMRNETVSHLEKPKRSATAGRKLAGGSGRMAWAGESRTTLRTAPATPINAAAELAINAPIMALEAGTNSSRGNRKNR